ncbi:MAG: UPF0182 family protein [Thermomicrobiales bacterium]
MIFTAIFIFAVLAAIYFTSTFWIRWWWFDSLGFRQALTARYASGAVAFVAAFLIVGGIFALNWHIALRKRAGIAAGRSGRAAGSRFLRAPLWGLTIALGAVAGVLAAQQWVVWRMALAGNQFGVADPIFGLDAAFYVFRLPALELAHRGLLLTLLVSLAVVGLLYLGMRGLDRIDNLGANPQMRQHLLILAALCILVYGLGYLVDNFDLMYSTRGFVPGPGFTDVNVTRPLNFVLVIASIAAAAVLVFSKRNDQVRWLAMILIVWLAAVGLNYAIPRVVQQTIVEPNQLQRELPFIANNIAFTRSGFALDGVEQRSLSGQGEPPASALQADSPVLRNVRLWDYRIARQVYQQLQSFVPYYVFNDADVDRYPEADELQQVLVSARELDTDGLPANAQTWTNQHLVYTHGYAAVVSPINEATSQGLPVFTVGGIPPNEAGAMTIERPGIYFGEIDRTWVAVNTGVQEVSGIPGDTPPAPYAGKGQGAISLDNYLRRVMLAIYLGDRRIIFTDELQPESKVLLTRSVMERITEVTPFLRLDGDPYLTIVDGRLIWIVDAYTATDRYPNSTPYDGINYARNSFKITLDAYDGTVTYYRTDMPDPIADAYMDVFPTLFQPISAAPAELAEHFRYPEELFDLQTQVFSSYHVTDPTAFYNGEDRWEIAEEQAEGEDGQNSLQPMEAYFMTLPLPSETEIGFKLIRPFTPINRPNMTAWMAAQGDITGNARLVVYRFPRQTTVFGPQQVEARINQDPEISSQFTLLSQAGSRVIRGNLLVIPVEQTVMYVQPVYLQATGTGGAPTELQFVIVATNQRVEMRPTLEEALKAVSSGDNASQANANVEGQAPANTQSTTVVVTGTTATDALAAFQRGEDAMQRGDWEGYGDAQRELETILLNLAGPATPVAPANDASAVPDANADVSAPAATPVP